MTDRPHVSPSQLSLMSRCPEAYRRRYVNGEKSAPAISLLKGSGTHQGIAVNFRQKVSTREDLPVQEIIDASVSAFETETHGGYTLEPGENAKTAIAAAKDSVASMAELHAMQTAPEYQPVIVEERFRIVLPGPMDLLGVIDLADDKLRVRDHKTSARKKQQSEADTSIQLTAYAAGHQVITGEPATDVGLEVLVDSRIPQRQLLVSDRNDADFEALAHRMNAFLSVIESGAYYPTSPDSWQCTQRFCGFFSTCRFVRSRPVVLLPENLTESVKDSSGASAKSLTKPVKKSRPKKTIDPDAAPIVIQSSSSGGRPGPFVRKQRPKMKLKSE